MSRFVISPAAAKDIESILAWSEEQFGIPARKRYESLLARAILDVSEDPDRGGSQFRPEIAPDAQTYHLAHSKRRVAAKETQRVKRPRHLLLYRVHHDGHVEIGRVLHDSMDFDRHLPDEYQN